MLEIRQAVFGSPTDPRAAADVTAKLADRVSHGSLLLRVDTRAFGDPAPMVRKQLVVRYVLNGKPGDATVPEGGFLHLSAQTDAADFGSARLVHGTGGAVELEAWEPGVYQVKTAQGQERRMRVDNVPAPLTLDGPWHLAFPPDRGAPAEATFDALVSWSEHPDGGIQHLSGTVVYQRTFAVPLAMAGNARRFYLDLGKVAVIAEVKLNGKDLGILWKPPFCVDAASAIRPGDNILEVRVTNLWVNRLIGDEQLPPDHEWNATAGEGGSGIKAWPQWVLNGQPSPTGRVTFSTWRHWFKDDALLPPGLLGPVTLHVSVQQLMP